MNKNITKWLAGAAFLFAFSGALPVAAQDAPKPDTPVATAAADPAPPPRAAASVTPVPAPATAVVATPAAAPAAPAAPAAAPAPTPNKGDTAWMFVATIMVIIMTIPGLALFYGGLVRT